MPDPNTAPPRSTHHRPLRRLPPHPLQKNLSIMPAFWKLPWGSFIGKEIARPDFKPFFIGGV